MFMYRDILASAFLHSHFDLHIQNELIKRDFGVKFDTYVKFLTFAPADVEIFHFNISILCTTAQKTFIGIVSKSFEYCLM